MRHLLAACVSLTCAVPGFAAEQARQADAFVDSIGINTHLHYTDTAYGNFSGVIKPRLAELGIRHIRDGIVDDATKLARLRELNRDLGIRSCLIASPRTQTAAQAQAYIKTLGPALVTMVEGENEPNLNLGSNWVALTRSHQRALFAAFNNDAATRDVLIAGPSPTNNTGDLGNLTDALDFGNIHNYYGGHHPESGGWGGDGYGSVTWSLNSLASPVSGSKPVIATETGYHNSINTLHDHRGTDAAIVGRYMPRLFLYHFNRGIVRSYPYELIDERNDTTDPEASFGLLQSDGTPKPAFTSTKNLISALKDPGVSFAAGTLDFTLTGGSSDLQHTLLQKRDGTWYVALWRGLPSWNADTLSTISVASQTITVRVSPDIVSANTYRPGTGTTWTARAITNGAVTLSIDDQVTLLRLTPATEMVQVNFQPATSAPPAGWLVDSGAVYSPQGNLSYGWNADNPTTRDRNDALSADQVHDTFIHLQKPANPDAVWEAAVTNGTYQVTLVAGDARFYDSHFVLNVEGITMLDGTPDAGHRWLESTAMVTVTDGRLTVRSGSGARNNKLCSISFVRQLSAAN